MSLPKVAVVILNWNGLKYLETYLPSVIASIYPNLEIILGDNGSTDCSVEFVTENYPQVKILLNNQNYGFTGGYNKVLNRVEADYFVLLNSDVEVPPNWIGPVISLMESDDLIAAAAPKILSWQEKNKFEHAGAAGGFIDAFGYPFCRGRIFYEIEEDNGQYNQTSEVLWASGAALFIKQKYWELSGGFDERFFAHMEEIDLCWRLKNMGLKVMYCAESEVYHLGGGTLDVEDPFKTFLNFRNNLLLLQKNLWLRKSLFIIPMRFVLDFVTILRFISEGKRKDAAAISKAHRNFLRHIFKNSGQRQKVKSERHADYNLQSTAGFYPGCLAWDFFVRKIHKFSQLKGW
ncbi:glycosyltransferase family 2 protein [Mucilaginibacter arboris]|uniref:Glycosyltransferase n=1 Tax=Mucilaginibacter arboris TaxID=2682090 RepID=A0A7K1SXT0_9SPHI|nr:glycosyltransferase family 2 protein [Mucilaginibacter arboris]MVN22134.1 glycosyltransferase [Mucilaginibacter arboris]